MAEQSEIVKLLPFRSLVYITLPTACHQLLLHDTPSANIAVPMLTTSKSPQSRSCQSSTEFDLESQAALAGAQDRVSVLFGSPQ